MFWFNLALVLAFIANLARAAAVLSSETETLEARRPPDVLCGVDTPSCNWSADEVCQVLDPNNFGGTCMLRSVCCEIRRSFRKDPNFQWQLKDRGLCWSRDNNGYGPLPDDKC